MWQPGIDRRRVAHMSSHSCTHAFAWLFPACVCGTARRTCLRTRAPRQLSDDLIWVMSQYPVFFWPPPPKRSAYAPRWLGMFKNRVSMCVRRVNTFVIHFARAPRTFRGVGHWFLLADGDHTHRFGPKTKRQPEWPARESWHIQTNICIFTNNYLKKSALY